ncbi:MAG: carbohydrate ABC transporter permease [Phycisphaerae bacterium]
MRNGSAGSHFIWYLALATVGITMLLPLLLILGVSVMPPEEAMKQLVPRNATLENYSQVFEAVPLGRAYVNSVVVSTVITLGQVITCSLAAFAFARLQFPARDKLFFCYLATMMIPASVVMIPVFMINIYLPKLLNEALSPTAMWFSAELYLLKQHYLGRLFGIDSFFALIVPSLFSAWGTFMLRQFFLSLPKDLEDAARIDGCGAFGIYRHVVVPLSKPALATLAIYTFMGSWKAFLWPLIITERNEMRTLPVILQLLKGEVATDWGVLMAGMVVGLVPTLIVFVAGQRFFVKGIQLGAIKG